MFYLVVVGPGLLPEVSVCIMEPPGGSGVLLVRVLGVAQTDTVLEEGLQLLVVLVGGLAHDPVPVVGALTGQLLAENKNFTMTSR